MGKKAGHEYLLHVRCFDVEHNEDGEPVSAAERKHKVRIYRKPRGRFFLHEGKLYRCKILLLDHSDDQAKSELTMAVMGGKSCPCIQEVLKSKEYAMGSIVKGRKS